MDDQCKICGDGDGYVCEDCWSRLLEWRLLYSVIVAGHSARFTERVMERFLPSLLGTEGPFDYLRRLISEGNLDMRLREGRTGSYTKLARCFSELMEANLDLRTCSVTDLEKIFGIGTKTSRFFLMWTREGVEYAALDTHVLKWMAYLGYKVPKHTPVPREYLRIEKQYLAEVKKRNIGARELDYMIWEYCAGGGHKSGVWPGILERIEDGRTA